HLPVRRFARTLTMRLRAAGSLFGHKGGRAVLALLALVPAHTLAQEVAQTSTAPPEMVTIIGTTPLPGTGIDVDKLPNLTQTVTGNDLEREGSANATTALSDQFSSININDNLDDPFQPDILFRGFEASPVLGTPAGLAVYQNGVRINEAFGDTVNWDLFPDIAINRVELVRSSPLYRLDALGRAIR